MKADVRCEKIQQRLLHSGGGRRTRPEEICPPPKSARNIFRRQSRSYLVDDFPAQWLTIRLRKAWNSYILCQAVTGDWRLVISDVVMAGVARAGHWRSAATRTRPSALESACEHHQLLVSDI